ncbi:MAG TPA: DUF6511 domain-containing protein [Xanthomonadales bacterium]|nr:DUF6511 domain-containing protein [Xanthomonadales bacterium]
MTCVVCHGEARGFYWSDPRKPSSHPLFGAASACSMRCLDAYTQLMAKTEARMLDTSEMERAAHAAALVPLGDCVAARGIDRPLAAYTREEILELVAVVVGAYRAHLVTEHERLAAKDRDFFRARLDALHGEGGVPF